MAEAIEEPSVDLSVDRMDGLISFYASHHTLRADKFLRAAGFTVALIPGPRELSPNCGVALRFEYGRATEALAILSQNRVHYEAVHEYRPRVVARQPTPAPTTTPKRPFNFANLWNR